MSSRKKNIIFMTRNWLWWSLIYCCASLRPKSQFLFNVLNTIFINTRRFIFFCCFLLFGSIFDHFAALCERHYYLHLHKSKAQTHAQRANIWLFIDFLRMCVYHKIELTNQIHNVSTIVKHKNKHTQKKKTYSANGGKSARTFFVCF